MRPSSEFDYLLGMLNFFRNHANSWITKAVFGSIVLVFALFFGYSQFSSRPLGSRSTLAMVNDRPVGAGEFEFTLENNEARYRQILAGNVPDNFRQTLRTTTLEQLITQKLMADAAARLGLVVSDEQLATTIRTLFTPPKGAFDPLEYTSRRQGILANYHFDIEQYIGEQLASEQLEQLFATAHLVPDAAAHEQYLREQTQFTFEIAKFDPQKLIDAKKVTEAGDVKKIAATVQSIFHDKNARTKMLGMYGIEVEKIGPITVVARGNALGAGVAADAWSTLFGLTPKEPNCPAPITVGGVTIVCHLVSRNVPADDAWQKERDTFRTQFASRRASQRTHQWMLHASQSASIARYLTRDASEE